MALLLLIVFIFVPLIEIILFVEIGARVGVLATIALVILTAVAGMLLISAQGLVILKTAQANLRHGVTPVAEVFHGGCLLIAGILLLVPGFLTDAIGLLLLVSPLRRIVFGLILKKSRPNRPSTASDGGVVIEGESKVINRQADDRK